MARRRNNFFQRSGRRRGPVSWVTTVGNGAAQTVDGTLLESVLMEAADWGGNVDAVQKQGHLLRIMCDFNVTLVPESTTFAQGNLRLFWCVYIIDNDDADSSIISLAAGSIIQGCRVLQLGCEGQTAVEVPTAQVGTAFVPAMKIKFDTRLRARLQGDEIIALGTQFGVSVTGTIASAALSGYARMLIREP